MIARCETCYALFVDWHWDARHWDARLCMHCWANAEHDDAEWEMRQRDNR